ncbi:MAG: hypothetical protein AB7F99_01460 [Vicinamibacterales bacterium]
MFWLYSLRQHDLAIRPFFRSWVRSGVLDRLLKLGLVAAILLVLAVPFGLTTKTEGLATVASVAAVGCLAFWALDTVVDHFTTSGALKRLVDHPDVILATRAEYLGGHPQLPHGRFVYLALTGSQENPLLSLLLPRPLGEPAEQYSVPVLDVDKTKPESQRQRSVTDNVIIGMLEGRTRRILGTERLTLQVRYTSDGGRMQSVELSSFWRGNDEIRNWRNYLVCAQAEADTGVMPHAPWKSLPIGGSTDTESVASSSAAAGGFTDGHGGDGSELESRRTPFARR